MVVVEGLDFQVVDLGGTDGFRMFYEPGSVEIESHFLERVDANYTLVQRTDFDFDKTIIDFNPEDLDKIVGFFGHKYRRV